MTRLMMVARLAMVALTVILAFSSVAFAAEIHISALPSGPMASLAQAGKSVNFLPSLKHPDGSMLLPTEYRIYKEEFYLLDEDAQPDAKLTAADISAELAVFGPVQPVSTGACVGQDCKKLAKTQVPTADPEAATNQPATQTTIEGLNKQVIALKMKQKETYDELEKKKELLKEAQFEAAEKVDPYWLLLLVLIFPAFFVGRLLSPDHVRMRDRETQLKKTTLELEASKKKNSVYVEQWNDPEKVRLRLNDLQTPGPEVGKQQHA